MVENHGAGSSICTRYPKNTKRHRPVHVFPIYFCSLLERINAQSLTTDDHSNHSHNDAFHFFVSFFYCIPLFSIGTAPEKLIVEFLEERCFNNREKSWEGRFVKKVSRTATLFLAVLLLVPLLIAPSSAGRYEDGDYWAYYADEHWGMMPIIEAHVESYLFQGAYESGELAVSPDALLNGGQLVEMVVQALLPDGLIYTQGATRTEQMMDAARRTGVLEGTGLPQPGAAQEPVTRYEAALLVTNALTRLQVGGEDLATTQKKIGDFTSIPEKYRPAVANLYALELVTGKDRRGRYCGEDSITLAESCVIVNRARKCVEQMLGVVDIEFTFWKDTPEGRQLFTGLWMDTLPHLIDRVEETNIDAGSFTHTPPERYWRQLTWPGLRMECYHDKENSDIIYEIWITMPEVSTFHGITVGSTLEELMAVYQNFGQLLEDYRNPGYYEYTPADFAGSYYPGLVFHVEDNNVIEIKTSHAFRLAYRPD